MTPAVKLSGVLLLVSLLPAIAAAQEVTDPAAGGSPEPTTEVLLADAGPPREELTGRPITFDAEAFTPPEGETIQEILWELGDGIRITGPKATHTYRNPGSYLVKLRIATNQQTYTDTTEIRIFQHLIILVADNSAGAEQISLRQAQAAENNILLRAVRGSSNGPDVLIEEELTGRLLDIKADLASAHTIIMWTSGGIGANVLTKLAQNLRQAGSPATPSLSLADKGIILLSETPFTVLRPSAQSAFDQLQPSYVILARPPALDLLATTSSSEEAREKIIASPLEYRLLGAFSARTVSDLNLTNFMSFGINFLVNRGVPINSIVLILMLPVIATIIAFARQVIGLKAFGLLTPAMTCISFLVMGLRYGLIVFVAILLAGTATRFVLRRLRLLYLPRMALVLTSISLALLLLLGLGSASVNERSNLISFSIFPALILTLLAEDFIAAQFKSGLRTALTVTAWTLTLATVCYFIVSSELFRTLVLSYPEIVLLAIPINIILGQWSGLRLTEYFRFRELLRHGKTAP